MAQNEDVRINLNFNTNADDATKDIKDLGNAIDDVNEKPQEINFEFKSAEGSIGRLKELKRAIKDVALGSAEYNKLFGDIDELEEKLAGAKKGASDFTDTLANQSGVLGMVGKGINAAKESFGSFNAALKTSVIGIIVTLLGGLFGAFNNNEGAMKKIQPLLVGMEKIFGGIFKVVEPLFNILVDLAISALPLLTSAVGEVYSYVSALGESFGAIGKAISKLIAGDFKGAWESAKSSVTDFSKHHDEAKNRYIAGTKEQTKTEKEESEKRAEALRKEQEKKDAIAAKAKADKEKAEKEEKERLAKAAEDEKKRVEDIDKEIIAFQALRNKTELDLKVQSNKDKLAADAAFFAEIDAREDKISSDSIARAEATAQAKKSIQDAELNAIEGAVHIASSLLSKTKDQQRAGLIAENALGIAKTVINTQAANAAVTLKYALVPGGQILAAGEIAANNINAGISIATSVAATAKGLSAIGGGGGSPSSASIPSGGVRGGADVQPNVAFQASQGNQLAGAIVSTQGKQDVIRAYVVASDVTTAQALDNNKISSTSI